MVCKPLSVKGFRAGDTGLAQAVPRVVAPCPRHTTTGGQNKPAMRTRTTARRAVRLCETRKRQLGLETARHPEAPIQRGSESNT